MFLFIFLNILYFLFINYLSQNAEKFKTIIKDLEILLFKKILRFKMFKIILFSFKIFELSLMREKLRNFIYDHVVFT